MPEQRRPPLVPGITIGAEIVDRPGTWRGEDAAGACDVTVFAVGDEPGLRAAAVASLAVVRTPGAGCRAPVRDVVATEAGVAVVAATTDGYPAERLSALTAGQLVRLGRPLARELAVLHAHGLALGEPELTTEVLIDAAGGPRLLLDGWARRRLSGGALAAPARDVLALQRLLASLQAPMSPGRERRWRSCLAQSTAVGLARALRLLARSRPLPGRESGLRPVATSGPAGLRPGGPGPRSLRELARTGKRGRAPERLRAVLASGGQASLRAPTLLLLAVGCVAAIGWATVGGRQTRTAPGGPELPLTTPSSSGATIDWVAVLAGLDGRRTLALAGQGGFRSVDVAGSGAEAQDLQRRAALVRAHLQPRGLAPHVLQATGERVAGGRVLLQVTDELASYQLMGPDGSSAVTVTARGPRTFTVELAETAAGWRILDVSDSR